MAVALLVVRASLAAVFALAAVGKRASRDAFRGTLAAFGVGPGLTRPLALAVPVAEAGIAVGLLSSDAAHLAALAGAVALTGFSVAIARTLSHGEAPACNCFAVGAKPVGRLAPARNASLLALCAFVVGAGGSDGGGSVAAWTGRRGALAAACGVLGAAAAL